MKKLLDYWVTFLLALVLFLIEAYCNMYHISLSPDAMIVLVVMILFSLLLEIKLSQQKKTGEDIIQKQNQNINILIVKHNKTAKAHAFLLQTILNLAINKNDPKSYSAISERLVKDNQELIEVELQKEESFSNPLTRDEIARLRKYIVKIQHMELFEIQEAQDFNSLSNRMLEDSQTNLELGIGTIILAGLAGFILGAVLTQNKK